jgi:DNA-binding GntR family transcriptional regulator
MRSSAADAVTRELRRELLDGSIPAGSRILPSELAKRFSLSVVPVREALCHLEAEGLVVTSPQRATYAADIGVEELAGVYDLRRVVEPEFACRSADVASDDDRRNCQSALAVLARSKPHSPEFYSAHRDFHWSLLAPAASPVIRRVLERLWMSVDRYIALGAMKLPEHSTPEHIAAFHAEHARIAAAFQAQEIEPLRRLLIAHFDDTESVLRRMFDKLSANPHSK